MRSPSSPYNRPWRFARKGAAILRRAADSVGVVWSEAPCDGIYVGGDEPVFIPLSEIQDAAKKARIK